MLDNKRKKTVLALGYFDSVHLGHQTVIKSAKDYAQKVNAQLVVVTFGGNLKSALGKEQEKCVFSKQERQKFLQDLLVDEIYFAPITKEFLSLDRQAFLDLLNEKYQVCCYFSGEDYRFGRFGEGTVDFLKKYAKDNNQECFAVEMLNFEGQKISTTAIKELLREGNLKKVNALLNRPYSITGKVFSDRKVGSSIGFPTINLKIENDKHQLKDGVYAGHLEIDKVKYLALINYGGRPTFNLQEKLVEAHIVDFNGQLYDREITLCFDYFMREIKRFENVKQLKAQLDCDLEIIRNKRI